MGIEGSTGRQESLEMVESFSMPFDGTGIRHRLLAAVLALGAEGLEPSNLSALFGDALERELARLRKRHNEGQPFPPYRSRLPGGRPRG